MHMKDIMTISFDCWGTIIKAHPEFKHKRNQLLFEKYNPKERSLKIVGETYSIVKTLADDTMQDYGYGIPTNQLYSMLLQYLGYSIGDSVRLWKKCCDDFQNLAIDYLPIPYDENTVNVLDAIREECYDIKILSNTNFMLGEIVSMALDRHFEVGRLGKSPTIYRNSRFFSDQHIEAKPNPAFFSKLKTYEDSFSNILHVGDNIACDIEGAYAVGMNSFLLNNNKYSTNTIIDLLTYLNIK